MRNTIACPTQQSSSPSVLTKEEMTTKSQRYNQKWKKCLFLIFKICKSVHHRTIQINHQPDAIIFQFIILTFIYNSTCFGRPHAHHQELNNCSISLWFYVRSVVIAVLLVVVGPAGPTTNTARLSPRYEGKTRGCQCSH